MGDELWLLLWNILHDYSHPSCSLRRWKVLIERQFISKWSSNHLSTCWRKSFHPSLRTDQRKVSKILLNPASTDYSLPQSFQIADLCLFQFHPQVFYLFPRCFASETLIKTINGFEVLYANRLCSSAESERSAEIYSPASGVRGESQIESEHEKGRYW
jgi:hypothetical protein